MIAPPRWTDEQLAAGVESAKTLFRHERLDEPLEQWKTVFDTYKAQFQTLFNEYGIADPTALTHEAIVAIVPRPILGTHCAISPDRLSRPTI